MKGWESCWLGVKWASGAAKETSELSHMSCSSRTWINSALTYFITTEFNLWFSVFRVPTPTLGELNLPESFIQHIKRSLTAAVGVWINSPELIEMEKGSCLKDHGLHIMVNLDFLSTIRDPSYACFAGKELLKVSDWPRRLGRGRRGYSR